LPPVLAQMPPHMVEYNSMPHIVKVDAGIMGPVFGTAFPLHNLSSYDTCAWITNLCRAKFTTIPWHEISTEYIKSDDMFKISVPTSISSEFASINADYNTACEIESYFNALPSPKMHPFQTLFSRFITRPPANIFLINPFKTDVLVDWLTSNVDASDYKVISRFETEFSLAFRTLEHATMYKLHQDII
jgi:hypothetical protein